MWGEAGDLDPDVGAHEGDKGCGVVPPAASAVGEDYGEIREVASDVLDEGGVSVAVRRAWEDARAAVEDSGEALSFAEGVRRIEHPVVRGERAVDGMELQPDGAQRDLTLQFLDERVVQVGVQVRHQAEAVGVMGEEWDQVLHRLDACGLRAVLAEQYRHVYAFGGHVLVE